MNKTSLKTEERETFLNLVNDIYIKLRANIIPNGQYWMIYSQDGKQDTFLVLIFNMILEVLDSAIREENEVKDIGIGKKDKYFSLFKGSSQHI